MPTLFELFGGITSTQAAVQLPGALCQFLEQNPKQVASFVHACFTHRQEVTSVDASVYTDARSSSLLEDTQEYYSVASVFTRDGGEVEVEVVSLPMEPGLAPETGAS